jgi:hypothetical protein
MRRVRCENGAKLLHVVSGITQNLAQHPANRTRLYKAELHGSLALDKLVEHVSVLSTHLQAHLLCHFPVW